MRNMKRKKILSMSNESNKIHYFDKSSSYMRACLMTLIVFFFLLNTTVCDLINMLNSEIKWERDEEKRYLYKFNWYYFLKLGILPHIELIDRSECAVHKV